MLHLAFGLIIATSLIRNTNSLPRSQSPVQRYAPPPSSSQFYYDASYDNTEPYDTEDPRSINNAPPIPKEPFDLAKKYSGIPSLFLVSFSTTVSSFILLSLLSQMILSFVPGWMTILLSIIMAISVFTPSDLGTFSKSLGVLSIELLRNSNIVVFISDINRYLSAAIGLKERKPYPPGDNPWKYSPPANAPNALQYNQYRTMAASILAGAYTGWTITKPIPLVPSWIIGLGVGVASGYIATLKDARGDMVRFMGNSVMQGLDELRALSEEVRLGDKFSRVSAQTTAFLNRIDSKYHLMSKAKAAVGTAVSFFRLAMNRVQSDIEQDAPEPTVEEAYSATETSFEQYEETPRAYPQQMQPPPGEGVLNPVLI